MIMMAAMIIDIVLLEEKDRQESPQLQPHQGLLPLSDGMSFLPRPSKYLRLTNINLNIYIFENVNLDHVIDSYHGY